MNKSFTTIMISVACLLIMTISTMAQMTPQPADTEKTPQYGGELMIASRSKPPHLNSAIASGMGTGIPATQIFAFLLRLNHDWEYEPYLAESWEIAPDGLAVTFHLRAGATFHDGMPVTSEDVAFSLLTIQKYHPFSDMLAAVENVETPDPLTAVVRLHKPHPALMTALASPMTPILPKHVYGDGQDIKTHPANLNPIGAGPFQFVSFTGDEIVLEKYPGFFLPGKPYLNRVIIKIMDVSVTLIGFETGSIHLAGFIDIKEHINQSATNQNMRFAYSGYEAIGPLSWLAFNVRKPPLDDVRVRQAFAYTIDRHLWATVRHGDRAKVATGPISPDSPFYSDDVNTYPVNTELANRLLDQAGYPRNDRGVRFPLTLAPVPALQDDISEYIKSALSRKLGVEIKILHFEKFGDWAKWVANSEFELALDTVFNWGDPVIGVHRTYSSRNIRPGVIWSNTQGYSNPVVDGLMEKASVEMNVERRKALYAEFQKQVVDDLPVYWLAEYPMATTYHRNLMGVVDASVWGLMFPFTDVYWSKGTSQQ